MHLEKYYADVVTEDGDGCIGYAARGGWLGLQATLAATLQWRAGMSAAIQQRTTRGTLPTAGGSEVAWTCSALDLAGCWTQSPPRPPPARLIWREGSGTLQWETLTPNARVTLRVGGSSLAGRGYAERLTLDVSPLRLPIHTLRWGRFVSAKDSVVWIEWQHAATRRWVWHNGAEVSAAPLDGQRVVWPGHVLQIGPGQELRSGKLSETILSRWPSVRRLLPAALRRFNETKWCAPASLQGYATEPDRGWVIHEIVRFR